MSILGVIFHEFIGSYFDLNSNRKPPEPKVYKMQETESPLRKAISAIEEVESQIKESEQKKR